MTMHLLFPVAVQELQYHDPLGIKNALESVILNHVDADGKSDESTGHVTMHHEPALLPVFELATKAAKALVESHMVDPELFDYNVVKSWMNMLSARDTPQHNHADAHISFSYYVNIPPNKNAPITFCNYPERYEPFSFMAKVNNASEWNLVNSYAWSFHPQEGTIFAFPSRLSHFTPRMSDGDEPGIKTVDDFRSHRIVIAGDIVMTYKDTSAKSLGLQPIKNWRTFQ